MADQIRIRRADGTWVVRAGGAVLGESANAREVTEPGHAPVIFFPRADVAMAFLEATDKTTTCPQRGTATHYSIVTKSTVLKDAARSYETPGEGFSEIAGHLAFYPSDTVQVERI